MLPLGETLQLLHLYHAGAHVEALAAACQRDVRTVRKTLRQAGVTLRPDPPLPTDWRTGLTPATCHALHAYFQTLVPGQQAAWRQLHQAALERTPDGYVFASPAAYATALQAAEPPTLLLDLAPQLGLDLNQVLLAYAAWADQQAALPLA